MLSEDELLALFRSPESDRVERKASVANADGIRQAICAFANDLAGHERPGVVFVGQHDDGRCADYAVDDRVLTTLAGWRSDGNFQPFPTLTVQRMTLDGCTVAAIIVEPSRNTPVRLDGRVWVRVGPRRSLASPEEERRLTEKRRWRDLPFDAQGIPEAALDDIDLVRFQLEYLVAAVPPDVLAQNQRTVADQLSALRLIDASGRPTTTAILILGKRPQQFFPGAYVQVLRIAGSVLTNPIVDRHELTGTVPDQLRRLDELADLWVRRSAQVGGELRADIADYPIEALRQLFRNAVLHRTYEGTHAPVRVTWYDDRIEIQSPGGPYGQVTIETFGRPGITDYRNPTLAEALKSLGFVERFGIGLEIVRQSLARNGNPPAEFEVIPNYVLATVRGKS
ncbi:ATP-binding protein [Blastochloris sulfoviridis]|uniref:Transcriptional regulator n=1 Tax=Blastochloris sulfoviridis TaxID=50712 RepID=A0A5M6HLI5_9HYPH|nr:ATP-binding protein [Blastochloris sulfoviridis]KAA5596723.1 transcriptional regulator [Blastochloris sulfoviridis]